MRGPVPPAVDDHVAEGVAGPRHPARADDEQPVRPDVPVEPPDVGVVQPDSLRHLGRPVLAVHREEALRLHHPALRDGARVLRHAVQRGRHALPLHLGQELAHPPPVVLGLRHEPHDHRLVRLALDQRVPVEHGPHHRQAVARRVLVAREPVGSVNRPVVIVGETQQAHLNPIMSPSALMWCVGITTTRLDGSCDSMLSHVTLSSAVSGCMQNCSTRRCILPISSGRSWYIGGRATLDPGMTLERSSKQEAYEFVEKRRKELAPERRDADGDGDGDEEQRDGDDGWYQSYRSSFDRSQDGPRGRRAFGSDDRSSGQGPSRRDGRAQDDEETVYSSFFRGDREPKPAAGDDSRQRREAMPRPRRPVEPDRSRQSAPPERRREADDSSQTPGRSAQAGDSAPKPNQIEINMLGILSLTLEQLTVICREQLNNAEKGVFMKGNYFKIFENLKSMLFSWTSREPDVQYPKVEGAQAELVKLYYTRIQEFRTKQLETENRIVRGNFGNAESKHILEMNVLIQYVVMRDYQNRLFGLHQAERRAAAGPKATEPDPGSAQRAADGPKPTEPVPGPAHTAEAGPKPTERGSGPAGGKAAKRSTVPPMPERIPVHRGARELSEEKRQRAEEMQANIDELIRTRRDNVHALDHSFEVLQKIDPPAPDSIFASGSISFEKALKRFDEDSDKTYNTEHELVRLRLARMQIIATDSVVVSELIVAIQMRQSKFRAVLNQKFWECPRDNPRDKGALENALRKLDSFSDDMKEFQRSVIRDDFIESRLTTERLHMLLDSPSLYKAWLLASTPEEGCSSGT